MLRLLARCGRARVRVRARAGVSRSRGDQARRPPPPNLGHLRLGTGSRFKSSSVSASVSGHLDDDTKEAIVRLRSGSSSSFSVIVDKARLVEGGDGQDGSARKQRTRVDRTPSRYKKRAPPRITLAGDEAVGDMAGDDIEQLLSTVGKGEVWR